MLSLDEILAKLERRFANQSAEELAARERPTCALPVGHHCSGGWHWREDGGQGTAYARCTRAIARHGEAAAAQVPGGQTFETFDQTREMKAYEAAQRFVDACRIGPGALALIRPANVDRVVGCGKTHLLRAAARELARSGRWVEIVGSGDLTRTVRGRSLWDGAERGLAEVAVRKWSRCDVLILDDLGPEEPLASITGGFLAGLLAEREGRGLALASNLSESELLDRYGGALMSRLLEGAEVPLLSGRDFRRRGRQEGAA